MRLFFSFFLALFTLNSFALEFTQAEQEYIVSKGTIKVHNELLWSPFNFNEKGIPKGLSIDTMNLVASKVGLKVEYITGPSWNEFIEMMKIKELDVMLNIVPTDERKQFLNFTTPYQLAPYAIILNKNSNKIVKNIDDLTKLTLAVEKGFITHKFLENSYPNAKLVLKKDSLETLQAVSNGEAEATFGILPTQYRIIEKNSLSNLKLISIEDDNIFVPKELCIATSKDNKFLRDILQKGLDSIFELLFEIVAIFLFVFGGTLYWVVRLKKLQKKLEDSNLIISTMLNALPNPVFYKDKDARFLGFNRAYEEVFGVKAKDLIGKSVLDLEYLPFEDRKNYQAEDLDTIKKLKTVVREQLTPLKNGKFYHTIYSVNGFKDTQGNPAGLIGVFVDITKQKEIEEKLQNAMNELEELHKRVKSSIEYAGMIQSSLISSPEVLKKYFKQSYAVWQAKDTIGGDIYIFEELSKDECMLFLIDCTGHGVPGALGTVLVKTIERNIYKNILTGKDKTISPANLLSVFNKSIKNLLKQEDKETFSNVGFDGTIFYYNKKTNQLKFSSANNIVMLLRDGKIEEFKGDRQSVGYRTSDEYIYKEHILELKENDTIFASTDGLFDQNGGKKDLPMGRKGVKNILLENKDENLNDVKELIFYELCLYQADNKRNDDIAFLSFKI
jgi:PAS domain S-box-containing protein